MKRRKLNLHRHNRIIGIGPQGPKAYKPKYQLKSMNWEFHAYDDDFFPSVPHGHSGKYKLDVITGAIIDIVTGKTIGYVDRKDFRRLWSDSKFKKLAKDARQYYLELNPGATLPEISILSGKANHNRRNLYVKSIRNDINLEYRRIIIPKVPTTTSLKSDRDSILIFRTSIVWRDEKNVNLRRRCQGVRSIYRQGCINKPT